MEIVEELSKPIASVCLRSRYFGLCFGCAWYPCTLVLTKGTRNKKKAPTFSKHYLT